MGCRDAILAYFSDALLLWVNVTEPRPIHFMVTLSQSIWFHNPQICPNLSDWVLMETRSQYVGKSLCTCVMRAHNAFSFNFAGYLQYSSVINWLPFERSILCHCGSNSFFSVARVLSRFLRTSMLVCIDDICMNKGIDSNYYSATPFYQRDFWLSFH